ncbi:MAG: cupin domain-containing protein [Cypionkella sp.]
MTQLTAQDAIFTLGLVRHPEGGWYAETFVDEAVESGRARSTAIYYLLEAGEASHWHRVDAVEVWHYYAGAPLELRISDGNSVDLHRLGADLDGGERPQVVVPRQAWQAAKSTGAFTLVGCTVAPGFQFSGFELADPDWVPGGD